ncbi:MAG TPA: response regulator [Pyrinomonadaceae bacterium]|nr:response regulator [Pyrinomonadaceae bacterium]
MALTILYAEDHGAIRLAVKETLEQEGWRVEACADGAAALAKLEGAESYAFLIFDNILPGISGLELVRRARSLAHRRTTPVAIVSASEVRAEALAAGADVFLRKPQDVGLLVGTVKSLIGR